jgi:hypothetical protein
MDKASGLRKCDFRLDLDRHVERLAGDALAVAVERAMAGQQRPVAAQPDPGERQLARRLIDVRACFSVIQKYSLDILAFPRHAFHRSSLQPAPKSAAPG